MTTIFAHKMFDKQFNNPKTCLSPVSLRTIPTKPEKLSFPARDWQSNCRRSVGRVPVSDCSFLFWSNLRSGGRYGMVRDPNAAAHAYLGLDRERPPHQSVNFQNCLPQILKLSSHRSNHVAFRLPGNRTGFSQRPLGVYDL